MMRNRIIIIIVSVLLCFTYAFAESSVVNLTWYEKHREELLQQIQDRVKSDVQAFSDPSFPVKSIQLEEAYLIRYITPYLVTEYKQQGDWHSLNMDLQQLIVPLEMSSGKKGEMVYVCKEGILEPVGMSMELDNPPISGYSQIRKDITDNNGKIRNISEMTVAYSSAYGSYFVYIQTDKEEIIIPYFLKDSNGYEPMKSGTAATLTDFIRRMDETYDEETVLRQIQSSNEILYGSGIPPYRNNYTNSGLPSYVPAALGFVILAAALALFLAKHKRPIAR